MRIIRYKPGVTESIMPNRADSVDMAGIRSILEDVRRDGDEAVKAYTRKFDKVDLDGFKIERDACREALLRLNGDTRRALQEAADNLRRFAGRQLEQLQDFEMEINPGVFTGQRVIPVDRVGVYVPGGNFPLVSSLLMGAAPARAAGVKEIVVCTPPEPGGGVSPAMAAAAAIAGIDEFYTIGGVQAIGAMAYGTETIKAVDKIVGPGNRYVTAAKKEVYGLVGIDFVAGPSEVMVIADAGADPRWIAADLLAQAEHDVLAAPVMITPSPDLAKEVVKEVRLQLEQLETKTIASASITGNGRIFLVETLEEAVEIANLQAPEHLELHLREPERLSRAFKHYGTLFIGKYAAEVLGDYSSGLNHTLPTAGAARYTGGLSVRDFIKLQTTLRVEPGSMNRTAETARRLARLEGLAGHANAITVRMN
jgi:histidinol dehydrogenase